MALSKRRPFGDKLDLRRRPADFTSPLKTAGRQNPTCLRRQLHLPVRYLEPRAHRLGRRSFFH